MFHCLVCNKPSSGTDKSTRRKNTYINTSLFTRQRTILTTFTIFFIIYKPTLYNVYIYIYIYDKILLLHLAWTGTKLSNILDYQMVPTLMWVSTHNVLLLLLHLGCTCTTNQKTIPFGYLHSLVQDQQGPLLCFLKSS
jgi:hypothetical protein